MATTRKNAFSSEMKLRSSSGEVGSTDSFDADLKVGKTDLGPCRSQSRHEGGSNLKINLRLGLSTSSQEDLDGEQTFRGYRIRKVYECITNNFALNKNFFHIRIFFHLA